MGVEYQTFGSSFPLVFANLDGSDVPCVVCEAANRLSLLEIPGTYECPTGWTREYYGYLMSESTQPEHYRMSFECLDVNAEQTGSDHNSNPALFYFTEGLCNGLKCPPYRDGHELTCAVYTK